MHVIKGGGSDHFLAIICDYLASMDAELSLGSKRIMKNLGSSFKTIEFFHGLTKSCLKEENTPVF